MPKFEIAVSNDFADDEDVWEALRAAGLDPYRVTFIEEIGEKPEPSQTATDKGEVTK